ncbi:Retrovirus-related Pol polyprotein from transposon TNT 1-94 [Senna tora]|uniref:Retrovirus-related Pol polyprotein from transposon TNT 1-94 n=1 Tax=Senna tora TaxID=362788 RepID=A0A834SWQ1_9FABA|nr:Retrovirus-related Pol polyprotein from transposon TNT 1-94 [Senna tora]
MADEKNYLLWRLQISAAIQGHELEQYIAGKSSIPSMYSSDEDKIANKFNPEYIAWKKQDALLLSWLLSTMSESMVTRVVGCTHSYEVWDRVQHHFGTNTQAKIHQYRTELRNIKKGTRSMEEYLLKIKSITDALVAIGSEIFEHEHIQCVLEGLPSEYESFVTGIHMRSTPCTIFELEPLLIAQEIRVEKSLKAVIESPSANIATTDSKDKNQSSNKSPQNQPSYRQYTNRGGGRQGPGRGRGRGNNNSNNNRGGYNGYQNNRPFIMCQVCGKAGHIASVCYHRHDSSYQLNETQYNQQLRQRSSANMASMIASPELLSDSSWFPDSGATNHVTADGNNLMTSSEYMGLEQLHMGNGAGLAISSIGHAFVKTSSHPSSSLSLNQLLHDTREILLRGSVRPDGLYYFHDFHLQHLPSAPSLPSRSILSSSHPSTVSSAHFASTVSSPQTCNTYSLWHNSTTPTAPLPSMNQNIDVSNPCDSESTTAGVTGSTATVPSTSNSHESPSTTATTHPAQPPIVNAHPMVTRGKDDPYLPPWFLM